MEIDSLYVMVGKYHRMGEGMEPGMKEGMELGLEGEVAHTYSGTSLSGHQDTLTS